MSLDSCIKKAGKALSTKDADAIRANVASGMSEVEAVESFIGSLDAEMSVLRVDYLKNAPAIKNNRELKKLLGEFYGIKPSEVNAEQMKFGQESYEVVLVMRAREYLEQNDGDLKANFDGLLEMYNAQPLLNSRSSTSMENQAYSTPAPLAFLASRMAGAEQARRVYEPTAGNGMLLIDTPVENVRANELDPTRRANLESQGFRKVTEQDATELMVVSNTVLANPPFGKMRESDGKRIKNVEVDGYKLREIDHLISARALEGMESDGRATLIIGADHMKPGNIRANDKIFFNYLYENYNVAQHFEVDGDLYKRQGAGWSVAVIVVDGKRAEPSDELSPKNGEIERLSNWNDVYERASAYLATRTESDGRGSDTAGDAVDPDTTPDAGTAASGTAPEVNQPDPAGQQPDAAPTPTGDTAGRATRSNSGRDTDARSSGRANRTNESEATPAEPATVAREPDAKPDRGRDTKPVAKKKKPAKKEGSDFQTKYKSKSGGKNESVLTPNNMAEPLNKALDELSNEVGDIDAYVMKKLGYKSKKALYKAFMGLQVDSIAAAIYNMENNDKGVVIADQTGVGKGRQAAGLIRYALKSGKTPVFLTVKDNLFSDMYGDLKDIGVEDPQPFVMNKKTAIKHKNKVAIAPESDTKKKALIEEIAATGQLPEGKDMLFFTYSQVTVDNIQREAITALGDNVLIVMDESHNAAGDRTRMVKVKGKSEERQTAAGFMYDLIADKDVAYLSATFAKRPENMPIYYRTDLMDAVDSPEELIGAMESGGVPLQQNVSALLAESGQLFRRERSFDGIAIPTVIDAAGGTEHARIADQVTTGLRAVTQADRMFEGFFEAKKAESEAQGGGARSAGNKAAGTMDHTNFNAVVHNYVRQLLLALKAPRTVELAIEAHKRGEKPVIALESTMGSFLGNFVEDNGLAIGDSVEANYQDILLRALERTRRITIKDKKGNDKVVQYKLSDLDDITKQTYLDAEEVIRSIDVTELPLSPIDYMRHHLNEAGISVAEITGRNLTIDYSGDTPTLAQRDPAEINDRRGQIDKFNDGKLDALVLNTAGSTGLSIHASEKFKDQSVRHMIVSQPMLDVNVFVQMLGRVNRTGQEELPLYTVMGLDIPAEKRPLAVIARKMKSLNANTSANSDSDTSLDAPDMLNKYGDRIVTEYLRENPETARSLDMYVSPEGESGQRTAQANDGMALRMTGRMALLSVEQQEEIYRELETNYNELIEFLDKTGQNDLEARTIPLDAKILQSKVAYEGKKPETKFGQNTTVHRIDAKYQGKPPSPAEAMTEYRELVESDRRLVADKIRRKLESGDTMGTSLDAREAKIEAEQADLRQAISRNADGNPTPAQIKRSEAITKRETAAQQARQTYERTKSNTQALLRDLPPGKRVYLNLGDEHANGFVMNVTSSAEPGKGNPWAYSKTKVRFMVSSGLREIVVNANQLIGEANIVLQNKITSPDVDQIGQDFTRAGDGRRETRYVATGNLIAGSAQLPGQIINFTDAQKRQHQGILLPKTFERTDFEALGSGENSFAVRDPAAITKMMRDGNVSVQSDGAAVQINWDGLRWNISAPKSNTDITARSVRMDPALRDQIGDFYGTGKRMSATFEDSELDGVINRVLELSPLYAKQEFRDQYTAAGGPAPAAAVESFDGQGTPASELAAPVAKPDEPQFQRAPRAITLGKGLSVEAAQRGIERVVKNWTNGPSIRVVATEAELPAEVQSYIKPGDRIGGLRLRDQVYLVAGTLRTQAELLEALAHEAVGHYAMERMPEFGETINDVLRAQGSDARIDEITRKVRRLYGVMPAQNEAGEIIAFMAQEGIKHPYLTRLVTATRKLLRALGFKMKFSSTDLRGMIEAAARNLTAAPAVAPSQPAFQRVEGEIDSTPMEAFEYAPSAETTTQALTRKYVDKFNPLFRAQEEIIKAGRTIQTDHDAHLAQRLFHGRAEDQINKFEQDYLEPLAEMMASTKIAPEELGMYLYARHAFERNEQIARINPEMQDGGSGMTNAQAAEILRKGESEGKAESLIALAAIVDQMTETTRDLMVESGLESDGVVAGWRGLAGDEVMDENGEDIETLGESLSYNHYVPLQGFSEPDPRVKDGLRIGRGMAIKGKESLKALGRRTLAENPLMNVIVNAERTIVRAEKARVGQSLLAQATEHPNDSFWKVHNPGSTPMTRRYNPTTGEVEMVSNRGEFSDDRFFPVKVDGQQHYVEIFEPRLAEAMQNLNVVQLEGLWNTAAKATRFLSVMSTSANPAFIPVNFVRDIQTAVVHILADQKTKGNPLEGKKIAGRVVKSAIPAMRGVWRGFNNMDNPGEWGERYQEFVAIGGKVGHYGQIDLKSQAANLQKLIDMESPGPWNMTKRAWRGLVTFMDKLNTAVENSVRLSLYVHAVREGVPKKQAAGIAKGLTVDFNQRGANGAKMNALYMFSNAGVQGSTTIIQRLKRAGAARTIAGGIVASSYAMTELMAYLSGEDDDGDTLYSDIPDYVKERNFIIMDLWGESERGYWTIPQPYGYNAFSSMGVALADLRAGRKDAAQAGMFVAGSFVAAFNPLGLETSDNSITAVTKTVTPTVAKPAIHIATNENYFGAPLMPDYTGDTRPDSKKAWRTTPDQYKAVAEWLNEVSGGSDWRDGSVSVSPEHMQELFEFGTGGLGRTLERTAKLGAKAIKGEEITTRDVPLARRFKKEVDNSTDRNDYYERKDKIAQVKREYAAKKGTEKYLFRKEFASEIKMIDPLKRTESELRRLRKASKAADARGDADLVEALQERQDRAIDRFNRIYSGR